MNTHKVTHWPSENGEAGKKPRSLWVGDCDNCNRRVDSDTTEFGDGSALLCSVDCAREWEDDQATKWADYDRDISERSASQGGKY